MSHSIPYGIGCQEGFAPSTLLHRIDHLVLGLAGDIRVSQGTRPNAIAYIDLGPDNAGQIERAAGDVDWVSPIIITASGLRLLECASMNSIPAGGQPWN